MLIKFFLNLVIFGLLTTLVLAGEDCLDIKNKYGDEVDCVTNSNGEVTKLIINNESKTVFDFSVYNSLTELFLKVSKDYKYTYIQRGINIKLPKSLKILTLEGILLNQNNVDTISDLTNLRELIFTKFKLSGKLNFYFFKNLTKLEKLIISDKNSFKVLPESFYSLVNLKTLKVSNTKISSISSKIGNLKNLQKLDLSINHIDRIPEELKNLENLEELNLWGNNISRIQKSFENLKNLTLLNCGMNNIYEIPNELKSLVNLKELDLRYNKLTKIPPCIEYFKNLSILKISSNKINDVLPQYLNSFPNLKEIHFHGNSNIRGQMLTNKNLKVCLFEKKYSLCLVEEIPCVKQYNYKKCNTSKKLTTSSRPNKISTNGKCGPKYGNTKCPTDECCSKYGYCGSNKGYCGKGCQSKFGKCH